MIVKRIVPLTADNWSDLEELFTKGPCSYCWCMWWRVPRAEYQYGSANRRALRAAVDADVSVGLLAYGGAVDDGEEKVVGWCAVAPRTSYRRLATALVARGGSNEPDRWAVPCFFVRQGYRRRGISDALLDAACEHSRAHGARVIEGYPTTSDSAGATDFYGTKRLFERHGFVVVREPTPKRALMERVLVKGRQRSQQRAERGRSSTKT
jgi:GNAT superfamily N-acetyltransferase